MDKTLEVMKARSEEMVRILIKEDSYSVLHIFFFYSSERTLEPIFLMIQEYELSDLIENCSYIDIQNKGIGFQKYHICHITRPRR